MLADFLLTGLFFVDYYCMGKAYTTLLICALCFVTLVKKELKTPVVATVALCVLISHFHIFEGQAHWILFLTNLLALLKYFLSEDIDF